MATDSKLNYSRTILEQLKQLFKVSQLLTLLYSERPKLYATSECNRVKEISATESEIQVKEHSNETILPPCKFVYGILYLILMYMLSFSTEDTDEEF